VAILLDLNKKVSQPRSAQLAHEAGTIPYLPRSSTSLDQKKKKLEGSGAKALKPPTKEEDALQYTHSTFWPKTGARKRIAAGPKSKAKLGNRRGNRKVKTRRLRRVQRCDHENQRLRDLNATGKLRRQPCRRTHCSPQGCRTSTREMYRMQIPPAHTNLTNSWLVKAPKLPGAEHHATPRQGGEKKRSSLLACRSVQKGGSGRPAGIFSRQTQNLGCWKKT